MAEESGGGRPSLAKRTAKIKKRVQELQQRRGQLAAGERPSPESVDLARHRAEESMRNAKDAHHAAAQRHEELARAHERAANNYQQAAMRFAIQGVDDPDLLQDQADQHWQAAHDNRLRSIEDRAQADNPEQSSSG
ncbi:hypothetical protein [Mycobacterium mantenii]|uniref:Uncharacterized protein n=1 Tax=Mycobacterium mantenii TaxID=560555 RepID=A0A1A2TVW8_MYCNT|nr:hypothetical protein [Mycobacterium mantenii]OBH47003.1 hypothetical protein A5688_05060 [Mycobacterium mantenii]OBH52127.1 hypothetical protein A5687_10050 [Mycobacterium mantenii]OBH76171.1 hypothetical protein A5682_25505 [Mycobacterium mantenii]OBH80524.1 hypothetical protein A5683_15120 [Mycobacterium mantenii]